MNQVTKRFYENNESETIPVLGIPIDGLVAIF